MFNIKKALKTLPKSPGVYLMKDVNDAVIYVGKAKILKNRVPQYFRTSTKHTNKIKRMVSLVTSFEYIITDSELEALILECNLIKKYWPEYNTMLKDDKSYPYIKITTTESFPRIFISRNLKHDKNKYFGPYPNSYYAKEIIVLLKKLFKLRSCKRILPRDINKKRACLNYDIKQCSAPCISKISQKDYSTNINKAITFLNGNFNDILSSLETKMLTYSENLNFEKAAEYRDYIKAIKHISEKQKIIQTSKNNQDIIAYAKTNKEALIQIFFIREGKLIGREHFRITNIDIENPSEIISSFIKQFYSGTPFIPSELIIQESIPEKAILENWLSNKRGSKVTLIVPQKGTKNKLLDLAIKNAKLTLEHFGDLIKKEEDRTIGALKELAISIGIKKQISRIEAFDISTHQGVATVGSMVVFENGIAKKSDYRKFKLDNIFTPDDYACMYQVLTRRLTHALQEQKDILTKGLDPKNGSFSKLPDIILMDGGKGQVNIALKVLNELDLEIPVCGMVKDDTHSTRGLYYNNTEIFLPKSSEAFKLVARIQDEAHRFAIEYHRATHSKLSIHSILDDIQGIGPTRRKELMKHFGSIEKIKQAPLSELVKVNKINASIAETIYKFFH